jgi:hypothetical protein
MRWSESTVIFLSGWPSRSARVIKKNFEHFLGKLSIVANRWWFMVVSTQSASF